MRTESHVGVSTKRSSAEAGREAAEEALRVVPEPAFVLVFSTTGHEQSELLDSIHEVCGDIPMSGCSGEGIITAERSDERTFSVAVMAIASPHIEFATLFSESYGADPKASGHALGDALASSGLETPRVVLVFPDGLVGNCTDFLASLREQLPKEVPIVGGTSADSMAFDRTYQYHDWKAYSGGVSAVAIFGDVTVEIAVSHGCTPIGLQRTVTRADNGWVHEIDGRPAWDIFKEYLDGDPKDLNAEGIVHLCIGEALGTEQATDYDKFIIRTPIDLNKETGSLFFAGGLETGKSIQLTRRDPMKIRESAIASAEDIKSRHANSAPALLLQFDCAGRGRVLFGQEATAAIVTPLQETLGTTIPWIGFHTFGEIAPLGGKPYHHNYTVALCALYDPVSPETSEPGPT